MRRMIDKLLIILLPENGDIRSNGIKKTVNNRGHTIEMAGAKFAAQYRRQFRYRNRCLVLQSKWINLVMRGSEQDVYASAR